MRSQSVQLPIFDADDDAIVTTLRTALAERLGESRYELWFGEGVELGVKGQTLDVGVPNTFVSEWIQAHFAKNLAEVAERVAGRPLELAFHVADELCPPIRTGIEPVAPPPAPRTPASPTTPQVQPHERPRSSQGRVSRRLDDFITGPCNRLAHAAALEMVQSPGSGFNPLVIHGAVGLGKTHLLEGISSGLRARHPGSRIIQLTAEAFTNSFLDAMRTGGLNGFRSKYRGADILLVDDVHFLAAKRATQDEFLHTFNALVSEGAAVVLATDQHPRKIAKLTDELATRFMGGMVVKLEAPDPSTRKAILKAKAQARRVDVPDAVLSYVAEHLRSSVRELEGALHSLIAQATLTGKRLDLALAKSALRDTIRHTAQSVALRDVERSVCQLFHLDGEALKTENRARAVSYPRMVAMYLARRHTGAAYSEIGRYFGGRNHSTVISAEKKVVGWLKEEQQTGLLAGFERVADAIAALERSLGI